MTVSFSLKFPIEPFKIITEKSEILMFGSCFTEHIGNKLLSTGFKTTINPFGILFNPISLANAIKRISQKEIYNNAELLKNHEDRFVSFDHHGRFSGNDADKVIEEINDSLIEANKSLKSSNCIFITLGSAWVYRHIIQNRVVANCHKIPNSEFKKKLLDIDTIVNSLTNVINEIREINADIKIIFTISPVKHLRDGVVENQQSKATLILAMADILKNKKREVYYFPAYEIVTDELRDYRFFETDHAHPNQMAIDYVWERFVETCFTPKAIEKSAEAENLIKALNHKPLYNDGTNENLKYRIKSYLDKYPIE
ncbi:MAG: GSCFA domain-containing protein [Bacteroidia bacterium]